MMKSISWESNALFWLLWAMGMHIDAHTYIQAKHSYIIYKLMYIYIILYINI